MLSTPCRFVLAVSLVLAAPASGRQATTRSDAEHLKSALQSLTASEPGASVALGRSGEEPVAQARGVASLELPLALEEASVFRTEVFARHVTSVLILQASVRGELSLDQPVADLLPQFTGLEPAPLVRHLLAGTSGLRDVRALLAMRGSEALRSTGLLDAVDLLALQAAPLHAPGREARGSGASEALCMAAILEMQTAMPLRLLAQQRLFEPLGLAHTRVVDDPLMVVEGRVQGYQKTMVGWIRTDPRSRLVGLDNVYTSATDLVRWGRALLEPEVLGKELAALVLGGYPPVEGEVSGDWCQLEALDGGFVLREVTPGRRGELRLWSEAGLVLAGLSNREALGLDGLLDGLQGALDPALPKVPRAVMEPESFEPEGAADEALVPSAEFDPSTLLGSYRIPELKLRMRLTVGEYGDVVVELEGHAPSEAIPLRSESRGLFLEFDVPRGRLYGSTAEGGRPESITLWTAYGPLEGLLVVPE